MWGGHFNVYEFLPDGLHFRFVPVKNLRHQTFDRLNVFAGIVVT